LDFPDLHDEAIDIYKIDIAFIPDKRYVKRDRKIQRMQADRPERLRAAIVHHLYRIGEINGDCYDTDKNIVEALYQYPLFYKNDIKIDVHAIYQLEEDYHSHFIERLYFEKVGDTRYYYFLETKMAEDLIKNVVQNLTRRDNYNINLNFENYIENSLNELKGIDEELFRSERESLYNHIFKKSLYLLTGKAGSGKTQEITNVIETLITDLNEQTVVLAPTGKAALRLNEKLKGLVQPQTIDRFYSYKDLEI
jgi:exodeoxyribonuclease V alpha subunit